MASIRMHFSCKRSFFLLNYIQRSLHHTFVCIKNDLRQLFQYFPVEMGHFERYLNQDCNHRIDSIDC